MNIAKWLVAGALTLCVPGTLYAAAGDPPTSCKRLPRTQRIVKVELKPDSTLVDLVQVYATLTCKRLQSAGDLAKHRVNLVTKDPITVDELARIVRGFADKAQVSYQEDEHTIALRAR